MPKCPIFHERILLFNTDVSIMGKRKEVDDDLADLISKQISQFIQSKDHCNLLNIVDSLHSHGLSRYVDLPQIISVFMIITK